MADTSNTHASSQDASEKGQPHLPGELLYIVVSYVVAKYLDDLIAGPLALPSMAFATIQSEMTRIQGATRAGLNVEVSEPFDFHSDETLERSNPVIPLLRTGVQLRATTLRVLSELLSVKLSRERIGRLEEKPWHTVQLLRYSWINPAYIPYFRLRYSFHRKAFTSPMIMAYTLTSGMRFELQQLKEAMAIRRDEDLLVTYLALKDHIDRVSNSSNQPTILSNMISNGAARSIVSMRLTMLDIEMTEFVIFGVHTPIWRYVLDLVCAEEALFPEVENTKQTTEATMARGIQLDTAEASLSDTYGTLSEMLSLPYNIAIRSGSLLFRNNLSIPETVISARDLELLQLIIQHEGRTGFDYAECQQAALKLRDWMDSMYGREHPEGGSSSHN